MKYIQLIVPLSALMFSLAASAAERWQTSTIKFVYPLSNGDFVIGLGVDSVHCPSTSNPKDYHVLVGQNGITADGSSKIYAAALSALATGLTVNLNFDDSTASCSVNRLILSNN